MLLDAVQGYVAHYNPEALLSRHLCLLKCDVAAECCLKRKRLPGVDIGDNELLELVVDRLRTASGMLRYDPPLSSAARSSALKYLSANSESENSEDLPAPGGQR
jgi:hypothetical protein